MFVIPGFNFTNYESQSNFVVQNINFVFQNFTNPPFLFLIHPFYASTLFTDKPSDPTSFYEFEISFTPPFLKSGLHAVDNLTLHPSPDDLLLEAQSMTTNSTSPTSPAPRTSLATPPPTTPKRQMKDAQSQTNTSPPQATTTPSGSTSSIPAPRTEDIKMSLDMKAHIGIFGEIRIEVIKAQLIQRCPSSITNTTGSNLTLESGTTTLPTSNTIQVVTTPRVTTPTAPSTQQVLDTDHPTSSSSTADNTKTATDDQQVPLKDQTATE